MKVVNTIKLYLSTTTRKKTRVQKNHLIHLLHDDVNYGAVAVHAHTTTMMPNELAVGDATFGHRPKARGPSEPERRSFADQVFWVERRAEALRRGLHAKPCEDLSPSP